MTRPRATPPPGTGNPSKPAGRSRWKRLERGSARMAGTERKPNIGRGQDDYAAGRYSYEHKAMKAFPAKIEAHITQAKVNAAPGLIPVVVYAIADGTPGKRIRRFALLDYKAYLELVEAAAAATPTRQIALAELTHRPPANRTGKPD